MYVWLLFLGHHRYTQESKTSFCHFAIAPLRHKKYQFSTSAILLFIISLKVFCILIAEGSYAQVTAQLNIIIPPLCGSCQLFQEKYRKTRT